MNFRNRKLVITIRIILGLIFIMSGVSGLMMGAQSPNTPEALQIIGKALWDSNIFHLIKIVEIIAGLMLVTGFVPALALTMLVPICVGVIVFTLTLTPMYIFPGLVVSILTAYLIWAYWDKFRSVFDRR